MSMGCESGQAATNKDDSQNYCDRLKSAPTCAAEDDIDDNEGSVNLEWTYTSNYKKEFCSCEKDVTGKDKCYVNGYSPYHEKIFNNFMEEYNELDIEKINTEEKYYWNDNTNLNKKLKWKALKRLIILENQAELYAGGYINEEGEAAEDKDCEFEFILKHLSTKKFKVNYLVVIFFVLFL